MKEAEPGVLSSRQSWIWYYIVTFFLLEDRGTTVQGVWRMPNCPSGLPGGPGSRRQVQALLHLPLPPSIYHFWPTAPAVPKKNYNESRAPPHPNHESDLVHSSATDEAAYRGRILHHFGDT